jgi:phage gpG-like protein
MQITLSITDRISGSLAKTLSAAQSRDMAEAVGLQVVAMGQRAFKSGGAATLKISGALWRSLRIVSVSSNSVTVGSDRPYASIHQLGGRTKPHKIVPTNKRALFWPNAAHPVRSVNHPGSNIPARPFFPITATGELTPAASSSIASILAAKLARYAKA